MLQRISRLLASNLTLNEARIILDYTIIQGETVDSKQKFPISIKKNLRFCHSNHSPFRFVDYEPVYNFVRQRALRSNTISPFPVIGNPFYFLVIGNQVLLRCLQLPWKLSTKSFFRWKKRVEKRVVARYTVLHAIARPFSSAQLCFTFDYDRRGSFLCLSGRLFHGKTRSIFFLLSPTQIIRRLSVEVERSCSQRGLEIIIENCRSTGQASEKLVSLWSEPARSNNFFSVANRRNRLPRSTVPN